MAFNVHFYTFQKRINSTKTVSGGDSPATVSCVLKNDTDIINPTLGINGGTNFNPKFYNYCWISEFNRYYFIDTWRYVVGFWECDCKIDVLATFKPVIGLKTKYVLRSASKYNRNIVDTLYPTLAWQPNYYIDTETFGFQTSILDGSFVIGIVNRNAANFGAVTYYVLTYTQLVDLIRDMLPTSQETWGSGFTGLTDSLYRSIYGPFDYIKCCKWFPFTLTGTYADETLYFGNYQSTVQGKPIRENNIFWWSITKDLELPTGWLTFDAKYRVNPFAHIYIVCNPWGVIELNPSDFTDSRIIHLELNVDYISGDGILKIYKTVGSSNYFITQKNAKISVDINLTQSSVDMTGLLSSGLTSGAGAIMLASAANPVTAASGALTVGASIIGCAENSQPTIANSVGQIVNSMKAIDGNIMLIYQSTYFADEDNAENGRPLCENTQLNTLSGYIKCLDGDIDIAGAMYQELEQINEFLTNGFFYE